MFAYRTGMASSCNKACNTDKKALFSVFCDLWFREFVILTLTSN